jgi:hypothetical protein
MVNWHSQPNTASFLSMDNEKLRSICMFYERISNCSLKMRHKKGFIFMLHLFKLGTKSGWCVASIFTVQLINACLLLFYKIWHILWHTKRNYCVINFGRHGKPYYQLRKCVASCIKNKPQPLLVKVVYCR